MGVDVDVNAEVLACLDVELLYTVDAEDFEDDFLRELLEGLEDVLCNFPFAAGAL
jgi:hypothetical protein